jgi:hypothetical protein
MCVGYPGTMPFHLEHCIWPTLLTDFTSFGVGRKIFRTLMQKETNISENSNEKISCGVPYKNSG